MFDRECYARTKPGANFMRQKLRVNFHPAEILLTSIETFPHVFEAERNSPRAESNFTLIFVTPGTVGPEAQALCNLVPPLFQDFETPIERFANDAG